MKRLVSITTIALVILALTAGPAFALACVGMDCSPVTECAMSATPTCPMAEGKDVLHSACDEPVDRGVREGVTADRSPHLDLAAVPATAQPVPALRWTALISARTPDARGAPHLTAVLRL